MAAPTLQEVLASEAQPAGVINSMNELSPGLPANKGILSTLLEHLKEAGEFEINRGHALPLIEFLIGMHQKRLEILVRLEGPQERWHGEAMRASSRTRSACAQATPSATQGWWTIRRSLLSCTCLK